MGSWNSYFELLPKKGDGNVVKGDGLVIDGVGNLIYSLGKLTTVMGLSDIAVINTDDATLIVPRDRVEEIKTIVSMVKQEGRDDLL